MVVTVKNISEVFGKDVFTNRGVFCGRVADVEVNLARFRINALVVQTGKGSFLADMVGGKKGVVVPYQLVTSVGDVVIIKHITPTMPESAPEEFESTEV
jgi:sporulation protein YlmC with PRC-barrel domain